MSVAGYSRRSSRREATPYTDLRTPMFSLGPTPFDFDFSFARTQVRVSGWHWVGSAVLGWPLFRAYQSEGLGLPILMVWMAAVFVSILVHELGHVMAFRLFGGDGRIMLTPFGGLAFPNKAFTPWRQVFVSLAGPLAQVPLAIGALVAGLLFEDDLNAMNSNIGVVGLDFIRQMVFINVIWPLFNLVPILPLDGGRISESLFTRYSNNPTQWIDSLAIAAAILVSYLAYQMGQTFVLIMMLMLVAPHVQRLRGPRM